MEGRGPRAAGGAREAEIGLRGPHTAFDSPHAPELGPQFVFDDSEGFCAGAQADGGQARESGRQGFGGVGALGGSERVKEA